MINTIILGHALIELKKLPSELVNCVTTSPPFWGLRDYGIEPVIWDGNKDCKHDFGKYDSKLLHENRQNLDGGTLGNPKYRKNLHGFGKAKAGFCLKCGAWRGSLGLEPTFELYIKHLCDIFDEVKRVLRKDGTCFVNIGDSYNGSKVGNTNASTGAIGKPRYSGNFTKTFKKEKQNNVPNKSLCLIPQRFVIEMVNRGWIAHNVIIWHKPNCMPSSAKKRFTVDYEPVFFFSKSNKALFWTNEKTLECISKNPPGTKGIEDKDWEWRECPTCNGEGRIKDKICSKCKGLKKVKYSLWSGHDYWFEQQFDNYDNSPLNRWGGDIQKSRTEKKTIYEKAMKLGKTSKLVAGAVRPNPVGRNKRCVWIIPTQPFPEAHFAVYPEALIEPMIRAGCPEFVCKKCGKARMKIYQKIKEYTEVEPQTEKGQMRKAGIGQYRPNSVETGGVASVKNLKEIGYTDCGCDAGWESGIVLDPFMGAGTSALVALKQRKRFIGIEIKKEYIQMACKRISKVQQKIF